MLDLTTGRGRPDRGPGRHRVGLGRRGPAGRPGRAGAARLRRARGRARRQRRARPHRRAAHRPLVCLAGHLDTVPIADNLPARRRRRPAVGLRHLGHEERRRGRAADRPPGRHRRARARRYDLSWVFYDCEEVEAGAQRSRPARPRAARTCCAADLAILLEPTNGAGRGRLPGHAAGGRHRHRASARTAPGRGSGSTRSTQAAPVLDAARRLRGPRRPTIDGLTLPRGPQRGRASAGEWPATSIPDECTVTVNFRFAPDRSRGARRPHVREVLRRAFDAVIEIVDSAPGGPPGPGPAARAGVRRVGRRAAAGQARLDGRGPLRRARHPGAELRPGRPGARPHPRGARR